MIGKQIIGSGFRGVLNYMEEKVVHGVGELISTNMLGKTAKEFSKEYGMIRALKPNLNKAVYHVALSLSPEENLSNGDFIRLGQKYLRLMGFDNNQFVIYRHYDRQHPHIHIIANRVSLNGEVVSDRWNYRLSESIIRQLEKEFQLNELVSSEKTEEKALSKGQVENFRRTGEIPIKTQLQIIIRRALADNLTLPEFQQRLVEAGASCRLHENKTGIFGISFELDGFTFKGSSLGKGYTWGKIKQKLNYNERNQETGRATDSRKKPNLGRPDQKTTSYEHEQYSGTDTGTDTHNGSPQATNQRYAGRNHRDQENAGGDSRDIRERESVDESNNPGNGRNERNNAANQLENNLGEHNNRHDHRWHDVHAAIYSAHKKLKKEDDEDEENIEKKKKKGRSI